MTNVASSETAKRLHHRFSFKSLLRGNQISRSRTGTLVLLIFLFIGAFIMALPMILIISNAFKPHDELLVFPPQLIPNNPTLKNFRDMFNVLSSSYVPFMRFIFNSVFVTAVGTAGHIILSSMCAYPLAKKNFPGRKVIFQIIVWSLMYSSTASVVSNYIIMSSLGWIDTYFSLIVPAFGSSLGLYLMKQFMEQLPDSLIEAARIDGASQWKIFWRIVMPNVKGAWLTLLMLSVQSLWATGSNNYIYKDELKTLPYALEQIMSGGIARAGVGAAVSLFMLIVPVVIFIFTQGNIVDTMSSSGMKD